MDPLTILLWLGVGIVGFYLLWIVLVAIGVFALAARWDKF